MADAQRIIGACIRLFREQQQRTQESLAAQAGISYQYLSGIEQGKRNLSMRVLEQLSAALSVSLPILVSTAYDNDAGHLPPSVDAKFFRQDVPLPPELTYEELTAALNLTQLIVHPRVRHEAPVFGPKSALYPNQINSLPAESLKFL